MTWPGLNPSLRDDLMLWIYGHYKYCISYSAGIDIRRQNLTSTVDPRAECVKPTMLSDSHCLKPTFFRASHGVAAPPSD